MIEKMADRFNWGLSFYGTLGAVIVFLPKMITGNDIGTFLATLVTAAFVTLVLLVVAIRKIRRQSLSVLSMLVVYCAVSWLLFRVSDDVRTDGRWFVQSKGYKAKVLAQPGSANGELKHVEWDGWGFAGSGDTTVYLVFDPNDSLATAAKSHSPGKFSGIPCEALRVRRLESNWYTVLFYTDTDWDHCN
jgi:hypothetical protein